MCEEFFKEISELIRPKPPAYFDGVVDQEENGFGRGGHLFKTFLKEIGGGLVEEDVDAVSDPELVFWRDQLELGDVLGDEVGDYFSKWDFISDDHRGIGVSLLELEFVGFLGLLGLVPADFDPRQGLRAVMILKTVQMSDHQVLLILIALLRQVVLLEISLHHLPDLATPDLQSVHPAASLLLRSQGQKHFLPMSVEEQSMPLVVPDSQPGHEETFFEARVLLRPLLRYGNKAEMRIFGEGDLGRSQFENFEESLHDGLFEIFRDDCSNRQDLLIFLLAVEQDHPAVAIAQCTDCLQQLLFVLLDLGRERQHKYICPRQLRDPEVDPLNQELSAPQTSQHYLRRIILAAQGCLFLWLAEGLRARLIWAFPRASFPFLLLFHTHELCYPLANSDYLRVHRQGFWLSLQFLEDSSEEYCQAGRVSIAEYSVFKNGRKGLTVELLEDREAGESGLVEETRELLDFGR